MNARKLRPRRREELHEKKQDVLLAWNDEVCNSEVVPEVEIISLLQEHIPKYKLRADSLTEFGGYENQDWFIPSPALPISDEDLKLTPDQIRETLNYFLLCSNRVSQMTKTYNDIEAVTRLLEEKEKDLELTARIGKELLTANGRLETRVTTLESELKTARDLITQLKHDLHTKTDLLQVLTDDTEESSEELTEAHLGALRRRTGALERENRSLRDEAQRLAAGADSAELAERQLLHDIAQQLSSANSEASTLHSELVNERERADELQNQLDTSNARLSNTERNLYQLTIEHEATLRILEITKENQNALAAELADAKERYAEVSAHLCELQEQLRQLRKKGESTRGLMPSVAAAAGLVPTLHREMHSSVYSEFSLDSGIGEPMQQSAMQKIFETVQTASKWSGGSMSGSSVHAQSYRPLKKTPPLASDSLLDESSSSDGEEYPGGWGGAGVPGAPGAMELAQALKRLTPQEIDGRRALLMASHAPRHSKQSDSLAESAVWGAGTQANKWIAPTKLQIVKPMEGSFTLHTWAQLAKADMSNILEEQEGVGVRGSRNSSNLGRIYRLSDIEEDDDMLRLPYSGHIYTYTNSTVMHPDDGSLMGSSASSIRSSGTSSLASSVFGSAWSSRLTSRRSSAHHSPVHSRRESVCETPARRFTPTATPANSPLLGSPEASPPSTPSHGAPSLASLIASGRKYLSSPADASPSHLTLQTPGSLYTGLVHRSPMEQLTSLKRNLRSPLSVRPPSAPSPPKDPPKRLPRSARPRSDLGTVSAPPPHSSLGTLSSILFGRKGGLL